jgi:hypothetical protein
MRWLVGFWVLLGALRLVDVGVDLSAGVSWTTDAVDAGIDFYVALLLHQLCAERDKYDRLVSALGGPKRGAR